MSEVGPDSTGNPENTPTEEADERQHTDDEALAVAGDAEQQARAQQDQVEQVATTVHDTTTFPVIPGWNVHTYGYTPGLRKR